MCGRFTQYVDPYTYDKLFELFLGVPYPHEDLIESLAACYPDSYNIAPTQSAAIIHADHDARRLGADPAHFGLIPKWAKERSISAKMINARSETIWEKPAYRGLISSRRAVLPINGFYEWQAIPTQKTKQPWYIHRADENPMLLACVWDTWLDPDQGGSPVDSFSIITTDANEQLSDKHHRMPVILETESLKPWFNRESTPREVADLLRPSPEGVLGMHRVSTRVNTPSNDDPELMTPDSDAGPATLWG
ncbi:MAG: SOS response-associated peptidase [bacterium]|nr:SOS response-associated peptidase [bacterium]